MCTICESSYKSHSQAWLILQYGRSHICQGRKRGFWGQCTLHRKLETNILRNETVRPHSQFLHSCTVSEIDLYIPMIGPPICAVWSLRTDRCNIVYKSLTPAAVSFLGIFVYNFWFIAFAVQKHTLYTYLAHDSVSKNQDRKAFRRKRDQKRKKVLFSQSHRKLCRSPYWMFAIFIYLSNNILRTTKRKNTIIQSNLHCSAFPPSLLRPEAEFMNVISLTFLGIILRVLRLEVSIYNVYLTIPVSNNFCSRRGRGGKIRSIEVTVDTKTFVPITFKNLASEQLGYQ